MLIAAAVILAAAAEAGSSTATFPGRSGSSGAQTRPRPSCGGDPTPAPRFTRCCCEPVHAQDLAVYSFAESVTVSWAPKDHIFAVTERLGSDRATTLVQNVKTPKSVDVCAGP